LLVGIAYFIARAPCILPFFPAYAAAYTGHPAGCTAGRAGSLPHAVVVRRKRG
jgi:hypothetical protein